MCDYSLQHAQSRPAKVGEKLITHRFSGGTLGFMPLGHDSVRESPLAVCLLPGTEVAFDEAFTTGHNSWLGGPKRHSKTVIFRQIRKDEPNTHHDALETPSGQVILLNGLSDGQIATVLQLPAAPKTKKEVEEQTRAEFVG